MIDRLLLERIPLAGIARVLQLSESWLQQYVKFKRLRHQRRQEYVHRILKELHWLCSYKSSISDTTKQELSKVYNYLHACIPLDSLLATSRTEVKTLITIEF